jgi:prolyl-tRNA editing enzyme YbaK/EbsC (Cys-tRNA(Pro) deacylase)
LTAEGLSASAARVQAALEASGVAFEVKELDSSTRTAKDAAAAIGCTVAQIAKSIVFRAQDTGRPILVIASGVNRIDEAKVEAALGEGLGKADADFVRARTGYAIGGVPPLGHAERIETFIDSDLLALGEIWAAAGTPRAVFRLTANRLAEMTGGRVIEVK